MFGRLVLLYRPGGGAMSQPYDRQDRGAGTAYDRYLQQMDASMRQKVALTAAHLLCEGELADMGMGSGAGSHALAQLYPELQVIGVDVNPVMVQRARAAYPLPNLSFVEGDIAKPCFDKGQLDAIVNSSVLHHVTTFNGYDRAAAFRALTVQAEQLATGGVLVVRDFLDPGEGTVWLDLCASDGDDSSDVSSCSTARLFERFASEFRSLLPTDQRGFSYQPVTSPPASNPALTPPLRPGFRRYAVSHTLAVEFVLRKDYRESWALEAQEEYCYATQAQFETFFQSVGLRVLSSTPIYNPWIVAHRFEGKFQLWSLSGDALDWPATNFVIVGQKVPQGEGVRFVEGEACSPLGYLELSHWRHLRSGHVHDLVRRPNTTIDVLPWYQAGAHLYVLARRGYPRPILSAAARGTKPLDGATASSYVTEPLNVQIEDRPIGQTVEELLAGFPDIGADAILHFERGSTYYPSPGGIQEQVESMHVEIEPVRTQIDLRGHSGFSTSGVLRAMEAQQVLRAAQVGGLPDARLELNTYELLLRHGSSPGEWIGARLPHCTARAFDLPVEDFATLSRRPRRRRFRRASPRESTAFLQLHCAEFIEESAEGASLHRRPLEMVLPRPLSANTVATAVLLRRTDGEICLGIDDDDLPAAQNFSGHSDLWVAPAWRLPHDMSGIANAHAFVRTRLYDEYGIQVPTVHELGGRYHPSPGLTPEVVYPLAVEVEQLSSDPPRSLHFIPLQQLIAERARLQDGHLRIVALRAAHGLGLLGNAER